MAKFECAVFNHNNGVIHAFVVHAKKYTKRQALELFEQEFGHWCQHEGRRCPTVDDVQGYRYAKYYPQIPDWPKGTSGYGFCSYFAGGCFPVWSIELDRLREE